MKKALLVLTLVLIYLNAFSQKGFTIRDIQAGGYFQIENNTNYSTDDWMNISRKDILNFPNTYSSSQFYSSTSGSATIATNLTLVKKEHLEEERKLLPTWKMGIMLVRENNYGNFRESQILRDNFNYGKWLDFEYERNMVRTEISRMWRTDDQKKAFVAFGLGVQIGYAYNSNLNVSEQDYDESLNGFNSTYYANYNLEAKNALGTYVFLPVDVNVKIIEDLFVQLELRTGLKNLYVIDGPSTVYATYGIGIGARYVL